MQRFRGHSRHCGPGGLRVLVLGGTGFVGRHAVRALREAGAAPIVGTRRPPRERGPLCALVDDCAHRTLRFEDLLTAAKWMPHLEGIDVVLNCVGILRPLLRATYDRVHHRAPAALAQACLARGLRLVHVSALGLDAPVRSRFLRSKRDGERALMASGADWYLARPGLLDGEGGYGAAWLRRVAQWPLQFLSGLRSARLGALDVRDLGFALARLCIAPPASTADPQSRVFELGGPERRTLAEHIAALREPVDGRRVVRLHVPNAIARMVSHCCDLLHVTPFSFGHYELLQRDNVPSLNRTAELLARAPRVVGRPAGIADGTMSDAPISRPAAA